jgi:hypothetical protein
MPCWAWDKILTDSTAVPAQQKQWHYNKIEKGDEKQTAKSADPIDKNLVLVKDII